MVLQACAKKSIEVGGTQTLRKSTLWISIQGMDSSGGGLTCEGRIDLLEGLVDLFSDFGASKDNLATDEDEKNNLRFDHAVDEAREQFRFIRAEVMMPACKTLKTDGELDIARPNNILNLEVGELGIEAELLNDSSIFAGSKLGIIFRLGTSDNHLA